MRKPKKSAQSQLARERSARAEAESATRARDQFLAIVSHELRSPLNGIKSWTHVLENQLRDADPTVRRAIDGIKIGVEHQVRLIDDLLDVTRASGGNLGLAKQPMAAAAGAAGGGREPCARSPREKGIEIGHRLALGDAQIHGDPDRMRQIFVNLLSNAIKFTPAGGTIRVAAGPEGASARVDGAATTARASAPEFLPYVFDPFRQADQGASRRSQDGLGLGLALVQAARAELHGGHVSCESEGDGRGSTFPRPPAAASRERRSHGRRPQPACRTATRCRRSPAFACCSSTTSARRASRSPPCSPRPAPWPPPPRRARRRWRTSRWTTAAMRPRSSSATSRCRARMATRRCGASANGKAAHPRRALRPAIALTAFTQREDRVRALAEGFQMHLTKPVAPAELITVISTVARGMRI